MLSLENVRATLLRRRVATKTAKSDKERHEDGKERHFERAKALVGSQWKYFVNQPALAISYELLHEGQKRIGTFRRPPSVFPGDQTSPMARIQSLSRRPRLAGTAMDVRRFRGGSLVSIDQPQLCSAHADDPMGRGCCSWHGVHLSQFLARFGWKLRDCNRQERLAFTGFSLASDNKRYCHRERKETRR